MAKILLPLIAMVFVVGSLLIACTPKSETGAAVIPSANSETKTAEEAVAPVATPSKVAAAATPTPVCDDHKLCAPFRAAEAKCSESKKKTEADCKDFVELFAKLSHKTDCMRGFDKEPLPSVWICDEDKEEQSYPKLFERSADTLSLLKFRSAQEFYASKDFRVTLDGAVAETHLDASEKMAKKFRK